MRPFWRGFVPVVATFVALVLVDALIWLVVPAGPARAPAVQLLGAIVLVPLLVCAYLQVGTRERAFRVGAALGAIFPVAALVVLAILVIALSRVSFL